MTAANVMIKESSGAGTDRVETTLVNYSLAAAANVENLTFTGAGNFFASGNALDNIITGGTGNDDLTGFGGNDRLIGGAGADQMDGDQGHETFVYGAVTDSTGSGRDAVWTAEFTNADSASDSFDLPFAVLGIAAKINNGILNAASFDSDLQNVVTAARLPVGFAVLFTPSSGSLANVTLLVVDANGAAGYQAGQDLVIQLNNAKHINQLDVSDFI